MPIFEYRCLNCSHNHERLAKHSDAPPPCPQCNEPTERLIGLTAPPVFNGSGYYVTDFKGK